MEYGTESRLKKIFRSPYVFLLIIILIILLLWVVFGGQNIDENGGQRTQGRSRFHHRQCYTDSIQPGHIFQRRRIIDMVPTTPSTHNTSNIPKQETVINNPPLNNPPAPLPTQPIAPFTYNSISGVPGGPVLTPFLPPFPRALPDGSSTPISPTALAAPPFPVPISPVPQNNTHDNKPHQQQTQKQQTFYGHVIQQPIINPPRPGDGKSVPHTGNTSKGELICKQTVERYYNKPFMSVRPQWLLNPKTGEPLELDVYNDELLLAIEYNGDYHYKYPHPFHKTEQHFLDLVYRDEIKRKMCEELGVYLIIVPYTVPFNNIPEYIRCRLPENISF